MNEVGRDEIISLVWSLGIYVFLPDILTPIETAAMLAYFYGATRFFLSMIEGYRETLRENRERLRIRRGKDDRAGKVIDFRHGRKKELYFEQIDGEKEQVVML